MYIPTSFGETAIILDPLPLREQRELQSDEVGRQEERVHELSCQAFFEVTE
jgi:hypothetical protein